MTIDTTTRDEPVDLAVATGRPELTPAADAGAEVTRPVTAAHRWRAAWLSGRGLLGLVLLTSLIAVALLAPVLAPYSPTQQLPRANLLGPNPAHLLGTDQVNRDVFSRTLHGLRTDLLIVFVAVPIGAVLGTLLALAGTLVGAVDIALQRFFDVLLAFPTLIFAIGLTAVIGPGTWTVIVVIAVVETPIFARLLRASILRVSALAYVDASRSIGAGSGWVLRRHVLPNASQPLGVQLAISLSLAVFVESAMSFLGIGVRPPQPSLGSLIADGINYVSFNPAYAVGPLAVVVVLVLALQLLAQALVGTGRITR
ncbi:peptide/nickel transport system permease protein [Propionibacteriaceae bacterium ES.041]|uniref:ABC transporter permease n=1 Tax=Enemella evansiae TaxID=2016499 RepID=UPI000B9641E9|nr:ABC transporter permease [Enemella evansiae]OYN99329.1 peptide ABC transporter permease [Enemella evansiae]PFG67097.1 peptide/nickel transport system permease protein [Propionibacteriaceae bacterium ES.041]